MLVKSNTTRLNSMAVDALEIHNIKFYTTTVDALEIQY